MRKFVILLLSSAVLVMSCVQPTDPVNQKPDQEVIKNVNKTIITNTFECQLHLDLVKNGNVEERVVINSLSFVELNKALVLPFTYVIEEAVFIEGKEYIYTDINYLNKERFVVSQTVDGSEMRLVIRKWDSKYDK